MSDMKDILGIMENLVLTASAAAMMFATLFLLGVLLGGPIFGITHGPPSVQSGCVMLLIPIVLSLLRIAYVWVRFPIPDRIGDEQQVVFRKPHQAPPKG